MNSKSRVDCEADDLLRMFRSKQVLDLQLAVINFRKSRLDRELAEPCSGMPYI